MARTKNNQPPDSASPSDAILMAFHNIVDKREKLKM